MGGWDDVLLPTLAAYLVMDTQMLPTVYPL